MEENKEQMTGASKSNIGHVPSPDKESTSTAPESKQRQTRVLIVSVLLFIALATGLIIGDRRWQQGGDSTVAVTERPVVGNDGNKVTTKEESDIINIATKVSPSVVSITTQSQMQTFFGVTQQDGAGTGIVVSKDGYIMTNNHVVDGANTVGVVLSDGTSYENVRVVGRDPLNDVAFVKIENVSNLSPAELGNSSSVRVGQQVIAIGNSLGQYQNTVTSGIISGKGRPISARSGNTVESLTDLLQTDAAINPGNSGGPLLNMSGQVVGINTAVATDAQGIGFAIPINSVKGILSGVLKTGEVRRAFLGVNYTLITPEIARYYKLSVNSGAYVYNSSSNTSSAVASGSPADKAGVKDKDIITKINGVEIGNNGSLSTLVGEYSPGDTIELTVLRGDREQTIKVTLSAYNG